MAARANAGTSIAEIASAATTRPMLSEMWICSVRVMGRTSPSSRRRASSRDIVEVKGRIRTVRLSPALFRRLLHEMSELGDHQFFHREPHGSRGSGQRHDDAAGDEAGAGARHHRRRTDFLVAEHPEQLAKAVEPFFEDAADGFRRTV